jgi:hypothetical protein
MIQGWIAIQLNIDDFCFEMQSKVKDIKTMIEIILFLAMWIRSYGELALLYAEDLTIFIRRRNIFNPLQFRTLNAITRSDCYSWFGLSPVQLSCSFLSWCIPETFTTQS